jgi:RNA polymerase sigma-70 factor, ECF subfamily
LARRSTVDSAGSPPWADEWIRALYDLHAEPLMRFLLKLTLGQRQAAEDMLQETLLRAWQNVDKLPDDLAALRPWLFTVARRVASDASRSRSARPVEVTMTDRVHEPVGPDLSEYVVSTHTIRDALPRLSPDHQVVLIELYYRGCSTAEAAHRLGIPEGTVKSRAHYALRSLGAMIGRTDGD